MKTISEVDLPGSKSVIKWSLKPSSTFLNIKYENIPCRLSINGFLTCSLFHCSISARPLVSWLFISIPFVRQRISCICDGWGWPEWDISPIQYSFVISFPISSRLSPSCQRKVKPASGSLIHYIFLFSVLWICSIVWFSSYSVLQKYNTWTETLEARSHLLDDLEPPSWL